MNKTKLAVFCALIVAIMYQMNVDANGGSGRYYSKQTPSATQTQQARRNKSDRPYRGHRSDKGYRGGKQQEGQRAKSSCKGDNCQSTAKTSTSQSSSSTYSGYEPEDE